MTRDDVAVWADRATAMSRQDWGWVALAVGLALALRLPFIEDPLEPDEAGYLLVARQWDLHGKTLYGDFWVDRPPLLLTFFKVAGLFGDQGVRILGCVLVVLLVSAAALAGRAIAGPRAARWTALTAACLGSSFALGAHALDGELVAAPLVLSSCAATLWAVYMPGGSRRRVALAVFAGAAGGSAVLVKQNFVDALVFAAVLLMWRMLRVRGARRPLLAVLLGGFTGMFAVVTAAIAWATLFGPGAGTLFYAMYGFRLAAAETIANGDQAKPELRLVLLLAMAVVSGLLAVILWGCRSAGVSARRGDALSWAFIAMLATGATGVVAGESYWLHYLIQLVPAASLGVALCVRDGARLRGLQVITRLSVVSALLATVIGVTVGEASGEPEASVVSTGRWLRSSSVNTDTALVTYGHPNVLLEAGLTSPYRYLWSLPIRVRDPHLRQLTRTVTGQEAPTWIVEWDDFNAWEVDDADRFRAAVHDRYRLAATVCGHDVYLLDGRARILAPIRASCGEF